MTGSRIVVLVSAVVVAVFSGWLLFFWQPAPPPSTSGFDPAPSEPTASETAEEPSFEPIEGDPPRALIVGDSYAAGIGATTPDQGYAQTLATDLGWDVTIESAPGGGYGKDGVNGDSVLDLLQQADLASFDVIVVQSGYNDVSEDDAAVAKAVGQTRTLLAKQAPGVPVVVIGEFWPGELTASAEARSETIRAGWVERPGVLFLDPLARGWSDFDTTDDRHPDTAGHQLIASKVEAGMERAGLI